MTIITGPVITERTSADISDSLPDSAIEPSIETAVSEPEQTSEQNEVPCFTAPAPVRRKKLSFFRAAAIQLIIAGLLGAVLCLGTNYGGETIAEISRGIVDFLSNG